MSDQVDRPLCILLAEDNAVNQVVARRLLEKRGHSVAVARNGREALDATGQRIFDVVLMDLEMPEMSGLEATAAIRTREQAEPDASPDHRHDRPRHDRRSREMPGGRNGRLPHQAGPRRRALCRARERDPHTGDRHSLTGQAVWQT